MATAAVFSLALGVGVNTAVFSMVNALLLKPLPLHDARQLFNLRSDGRSVPNTRVTVAVWRALERFRDQVGGIAGYANSRVDLAGPGEPSRLVDGVFVTPNYFSTLGVKPAIGRLLSLEETNEEAVVISYDFWKSHFGSDAGVLGKSLEISRRPFTIVGVTARGFAGVNVGSQFSIALPIAAWASLNPSPGRDFARTLAILNIVGRLAANQTLAEAELILRTSQDAIRADTLPSPTARNFHIVDGWRLEPASRPDSGARASLGQPFLILNALVLVVLAIACVNVGYLLVARGLARRNEFVLRMALGASRAQILSLVSAESFWLALGGTVVGVILSVPFAWFLTRQLAADGNAVFLVVDYDWRVLVFNGAIALAIAGLTSAASVAGLASSGFPTVVPRGVFRRSRLGSLMSRGLPAAQIALTFALILVAVMFARGLGLLQDESFGFDRGQVKLATIDLRRTNSAASRPELLQSIAASLRETNGITHASIALSAPFGAVTLSTTATGRGANDERVSYNVVDSGYFEAMGIPLEPAAIAAFSGPDGGAIITESLSRRLFGDIDSVGEVLGLPNEPTTSIRILATVSDLKLRSLKDAPPPFVFLPWTVDREVPPVVQIVLRGADTPGLARTTSEAVERAAPGATVLFRSLDSLAVASIARERSLAKLSTIFAFVGTLLASFGLFGAMLFQAGQRTHEIAIRAAVGASRWQMARGLVLELLTITIAAFVLAWPLCLLAKRFIAPLVYGMVGIPVAAVGASAAFVALAIVVSAQLPLRRVLTVDLAKTLRQE